MSAIAHALNRLKLVIPREILNETFLSSDDHYGLAPRTLDSSIVDQVIRPKKIDMDNKSGCEISS